MKLTRRKFIALAALALILPTLAYARFPRGFSISYLLYDNFAGTVAALNGRTPNIGANWTASGTSGAVMQAGGGNLDQTNDVPAAYAFNQLPQNPGKLTAVWTNTVASDVPTMAIAASTVIASSTVIHGEIGTTQPFIRSVNSGAFLVPAWPVFGTAYTLSANHQYKNELYWDGKWTKMLVYDGGTIIGQEIAYDPFFATYGGVYAFWETLDSHLAYNLATAEAKPSGGYSWPALTIAAELANPTTAAFYPTVFGGTTTNSGSGIVIAGASYGQGGNFDLGTLTIGDQIYFSFDATSFSGGQMVGALLQTGVAVVPISNLVAFTANGRIQGTLTVTQTGLASFAIAMGPSLTGAGGCTAQNVLLLKNPPPSL